MGRIPDLTTPTPTQQNLLKYRDLVLKAARSVDIDFSDVVSQQKWRWIRVHNISFVRYRGRRKGPSESLGVARGGEQRGAHSR